jgi:NTE family protein
MNHEGTRQPTRAQPREGIALALSGGGFRAMLFHTGALIRMNELNLLPQLARVASVSGGSIAAAHLGLIWKKLTFVGGRATNLTEVYVEPILAFSKRSIDIAGTLIGFLTQGALVGPVMIHQYRALYGRATLRDLPTDAEGPRFILCATNLSTGALWRFSRPYMADWRLGMILDPTIEVATAVAASAAFPPFLAPVRLDLSGQTFVAGPAALPTSGRDIVLDTVQTTLTRRAVLADGGVYDNHALEPIDEWPTVLVSDGGAPFGGNTTGLWNWYALLRRGWDVTDYQVRALRRRDIVGRFTLGRVLDGRDLLADVMGDTPETSMGAYWSIDSDPNRYNGVGGLPCNRRRIMELAHTPTRLKDFGDARRFALVNWGYAIADKAIRRWYLPDAAAAGEWPLPGGLG